MRITRTPLSPQTHNPAPASRASKTTPRFLLALLLGLAATTCTDNSTKIFGVEANGLPKNLSAVDQTVQVGRVDEFLDQPLVARVTNDAGDAVPGASIVWAFANGGGATSAGAQVSQELTSVTDSRGLSLIYWRLGTLAGDQEASATLASSSTTTSSGRKTKVKFNSKATPGWVKRVVVAPDSLKLKAGESKALYSTVTDKWGNIISGVQLVWTSSAPTVAEVDSTGMATGISPGSSTITAAVGDISGASATSVSGDSITNPGTVTDLSVTSLTDSSATLRWSQVDDGAGGPADYALRYSVSPLDWSAASGTEVAVSGTLIGTERQYTFTGLKAGTSYQFQVVAYRGTISVDAVLGALSNVASATTASVGQKISSITVSPDSSSLSASDSVQLSAVAHDSTGSVVPGVVMAWSSSDTSVATVTSGGMVSAISGGSATITATSGQISGSASISVSAPTVARVVATPASVSLTYLGQTAQITAEAQDASGQGIGGTALTYSSSNSDVAMVDNQGRITAKAAGTALILVAATCCSASDTVGVNVDPQVDSVSISPASLSLQVGGTGTLTVSALDGGGSAVSGVSIAWSSGDKAIATVSGSGGSATVTAVAGGSTNITATASKNGTQVSQSVSVQVTATSTGSSSLVNECSSPGSGWIWCDDFDQDRLGNYFEVDNAGGSFTRSSSVGVNGSGGMRAQFSTGQVNAGSLKLAFGKTPSSYLAPVDAGTANYREVYWRFYLHNASNWTGGGGDKLARAMVFAKSDWSEAMIAHLWSGGSGSNYLVMDPASGTDTQGNLQTSGYNDFANLRWLGATQGQTPIFDAAHVGQWYCVEAHVRLNDAGQSNGIFEYWIDGNLEARKTGLNWLGSYSQYGINSIFLENYWNNGSPQAQSRDLDNFVVSTQPIGCGGSTTPPPSTPTVSSVTVSPTSATLTAPSGTRQLSATARDGSGNVMSGVSFTWTSSNSGVASVSSSGLVTGKAAGTATITATAGNGVSGSATMTVQQQSGSGVAPDLVEDFSTYSSTANMLSDPRGIYANGEEAYNNTSIGGTNLNNGVGTIELDKTDGYGGSSQSMKYTWFSFSSPGPGGRVGRLLEWPQGGQDKLWLEMVVKFSKNFRVDNGYSGGMAYKFQFGRGPIQGHGWTLEMVGSGGGIQVYYDDQSGGTNGTYINTGVGLSYLADDQWHNVRIQVDKNAPLFKVWVDGNLIATKTDFVATNNYWGQELGANINQRPVNNVQTLKYGLIRAWFGSNNPGW